MPLWVQYRYILEVVRHTFTWAERKLMPSFAVLLLCAMMYSSFDSSCRLEWHPAVVALYGTCLGACLNCFFDPYDTLPRQEAAECEYSRYALLLKTFAYLMSVSHVESCTKFEMLVHYCNYIALKCLICYAVPSLLNESSLNNFRIFLIEADRMNRDGFIRFFVLRFFVSLYFAGTIAQRVHFSLLNVRTVKDMARDFPLYVLLHCYISMVVQTVNFLGFAQAYDDMCTEAIRTFDTTQCVFDIIFLAASAAIWTVAAGLAFKTTAMVSNWMDGRIPVFAVLYMIVVGSLLALLLGLIEVKCHKLVNTLRETDMDDGSDEEESEDSEDESEGESEYESEDEWEDVSEDESDDNEVYQY